MVKTAIAGQGDNSDAILESYIERIERLEEEKRALAEDIREVYAEAKSNGFDSKTMRQIVKLRRMDPAQIEEERYMLETYARALKLPGFWDMDENEEEFDLEDDSK